MHDPTRDTYSGTFVTRNWNNFTNYAPQPFRWNTGGGITAGQFGGSGYDSDIGIAQAWQRLESGTHGRADLMLLRHETAERWYMRNGSPGYNAAHNAAQRRFPAPRF